MFSQPAYCPDAAFSVLGVVLGGRLGLGQPPNSVRHAAEGQGFGPPAKGLRTTPQPDGSRDPRQLLSSGSDAVSQPSTAGKIYPSIQQCSANPFRSSNRASASHCRSAGGVSTGGGRAVLTALSAASFGRGDSRTRESGATYAFLAHFLVQAVVFLLDGQRGRQRPDRAGLAAFRGDPALVRGAGLLETIASFVPTPDYFGNRNMGGANYGVLLTRGGGGPAYPPASAERARSSSPW